MIRRVQMTNWRAYAERSFDFVPGINFLMGANGTGKTSILEAVIYGLSGQPSTVGDRRKLLRQSDQVATVELTLEAQGQVYTIARSQSEKRAERAILHQQGQRAPLATSQKAVTRGIEELMGVSADFLQRIVYMAEGDVFRFLSEPPGKALDAQIRQVLGLNQLNEFAEAIKQAKREVNERIGSLQQIRTYVTQFSPLDGDSFEAQFAAAERSQSALMEQRQAIQQQMQERQQELAVLAELCTATAALASSGPEADETWGHRVQTLPFLVFWQHVIDERDRLQAQNKSNSSLAERFEGQRETYERILELLDSRDAHTATAQCPVCARPMAEPEWTRARSEILRVIRSLEVEQQAAYDRMNSAGEALTRLIISVASGFTVQRLLTADDTFSYLAEAPLPKLIHVLDERREQAEQTLESLRQELQGCEQDLLSLQEERGQVFALHRQLEVLGYRSLEGVHNSLVQLETRALSIRAAETAIEQVHRGQRNLDMQSIYDQVAQVWTSFAGEGRWRLELDEDGVPQLQDPSGRWFDLSQFSGGEKTALLVMLHTIVAQHFSHSDFLLIDEPLEHLDPVNRRSLVRFLVEAQRKGRFRQAIIATFEESLLRKYMSDEDVHIIHL